LDIFWLPFGLADTSDPPHPRAEPAIAPPSSSATLARLVLSEFALRNTAAAERADSNGALYRRNAAATSAGKQPLRRRQ
jgi:hypothetical protein